MLCSIGSLEITIRDGNQQGVEYGAFAKVTITEGATTEDNKANNKKNNNEIKDAKPVTMYSVKALNLISASVDRKGKKYLLKTPQDNDNKVAQRYLKAMGFNVGANDCKDCTAYGPNTTTYNCAKKFKCIDGVLGVASASALIIFQSRANPANPYAQKPGEPNVITGVVDKMTLEAFAKNFKISKLNADIVGYPEFQREDLIKDWKPVKYETTKYGEMPKGMAVAIKSNENGGQIAVSMPAPAVAWAMLVQGLIEYNKTAKKVLGINYLKPQGPNCGFRTNKSMLHLRVGDVLFHQGLITERFESASPFKFEGVSEKKEKEHIINWYNSLSKKSEWKTQVYADMNDKLKGIGTSNHGIGRAFDFVCGSSKIHYIKYDPDGPEVLYWLQDNAGRYGFTGLIKIDKQPMDAWRNKFKEFEYKETWHWEYLVDNNKYTCNKKGYIKLDCFIKEKRDELLK